MYFLRNLLVGSYLYRQLTVLMYTAPAILLAISFHEFAHGYMSVRLGDPTPKRDGRLTLNPFRHLDLWGTLCLLLFHVGWAKPIRVNVRNYKKPRRDMVLVALAGPVMNFILAFLSMLLYGLLFKQGSLPGILGYLRQLFYYSAVINVGLGLFNLIPLPPLDGSTVLAELVPAAGRFFARIRRYSVWILAGLLFLGVLSVPLSAGGNLILNGFWKVVRKILRIDMFKLNGGMTI